MRRLVLASALSLGACAPLPPRDLQTGEVYTPERAPGVSHSSRTASGTVGSFYCVVNKRSVDRSHCYARLAKCEHEVESDHETKWTSCGTQTGAFCTSTTIEGKAEDACYYLLANCEEFVGYMRERRPEVVMSPCELRSESVTRIGPRPDQLDVRSPVQGVAVWILPEGDVGWSVRVKNTGQESLSLVWDESSYVTNGRAVGRLIRGATHKIDTSKTQPNTPIPRGSAVVESFVPEALVETLVNGDELKPEFDGGAFYLVFQLPNGKATWEGALSAVPKDPP